MVVVDCPKRTAATPLEFSPIEPMIKCPLRYNAMHQSPNHHTVDGASDRLKACSVYLAIGTFQKMPGFCDAADSRYMLPWRSLMLFAPRTRSCKEVSLFARTKAKLAEVFCGVEAGS